MEEDQPDPELGREEWYLAKAEKSEPYLSRTESTWWITATTEGSVIKVRVIQGKSSRNDNRDYSAFLSKNMTKAMFG
jgi:hypothetical protein